MDAECLRLLSLMPEWTPARNHNRYEEVRHFLPIQFNNLTLPGQKVMMRKIKEKESFR